MAITIVQTPNASGSPLSFGVLPMSGNSIIVLVLLTSYSNAVTITDNQSNTYVPVGNGVTSTGIGGIVYWSPQIGTPSGTFTVTVSAAVATNWLGLMEVSGLLSPADQTAQSANTGSVFSATLTSLNSNRASNALVVTGLGTGTASGTKGFANPTSGYTLWFLSDPAGATRKAVGAYKIVNSIEASSATYSWTSGSNYGAILATFSGSPVPLLIGQNVY